MKTLSFRDLERLSAYLDGQLSQAERARLEKRLQFDSQMAAALDDFRQVRALLRRTPKQRSPRNFSLTPKMAGLRPPIPRSVPVLSWASAVAAILFVFTLGANLVGQLSLGAAAPMMAAAPAIMESDQAENAQPEYGGGGGAVATQPPVNMTVLETPTPEAFALMAPEETPPQDITRMVEQPPEQKAGREPLSLWPFIWLGLAVLFIGMAFLIRTLNRHSFSRKIQRR